MSDVNRLCRHSWFNLVANTQISRVIEDVLGQQICSVDIVREQVLL